MTTWSRLVPTYFPSHLQCTARFDPEGQLTHHHPNDFSFFPSCIFMPVSKHQQNKVHRIDVEDDSINSRLLLLLSLLTLEIECKTATSGRIVFVSTLLAAQIEYV